MLSRNAIPPLCLLLLASACSDDGGTSASTTTLSEGTGSSTGAGQEAAVTYYRDVKSILDAKCVNCHSPGNVAPFSLATYDEAKTFAPTLTGSIDAGTMPPWPPDNACRTYQHDRSLSDEQKRTLLDWIALGAPAGDPADAPPGADDQGPAIAYDVTLQLPEPYSPTIAPDEYRCFLMPWPKDQDSYVTALTVTPGSKQIVHHVIAFAIPPENVAQYQALDDADPDPGYLCYGGPGGAVDGATSRVPWLGAWVPGSAGGAMPEGTGLHVKPGTMIAVQMHYHTYPGAAPDQSQIKLRTAPTVEREAVVLPFTNVKWVQGSEPMLIPAGQADVAHSFEADVTNFLPIVFPDGPFQPGNPFVVHAAGLHMHTLGTRGTLSVVGDAPSCLLDIPRWDFGWQGSYDLDQPVTVRPGEKLRIECHWDNSAANQQVVDGVQQPPKDALWGEGTGDEMCLGILYITAT